MERLARHTHNAGRKKVVCSIATRHVKGTYDGA